MAAGCPTGLGLACGVEAVEDVVQRPRQLLQTTRSVQERNNDCKVEQHRCTATSGIKAERTHGTIQTQGIVFEPSVMQKAALWSRTSFTERAINFSDPHGACQVVDDD